MKYTYAYKTSDGVRHEAAMDASCREDVFAALRKRGIKAIKVVAADGSKANGEVRGVRKRVVAIVVAVLVLALVAALLAMVGADRRAARTLHSAQSTLHFLDSPTRRQPIGDALVIEKGVATGWADVFADEGNRFLASFAIPGVPPAIRSTTESALRLVLTNETANSSVHLHLSPTPDSLEARQIRAIVSGMKRELRAYLADGGTVPLYGRRLVERQEEEIAIYSRAKAEIDRARETLAPTAFAELWEERNERLRKLGLKTVAFRP